MATINIFDQIQNEILKMDLDSMVNLLNECFISLDKLHEKFPEVKQNSNRIFSKNVCILDKNSLDLLNLTFQTYNVNTNNYMIQNIQKGGMDNEGALIEEIDTLPRQLTSTSNNLQSQQSNNQQILVSPDVIGNNLISALSLGLQPGLAPEVQLKTLEMLGKIVETQNYAKKAEIDMQVQRSVIENNIIKSREQFISRFKKSGILISYAAPGALMYYFKELINNSALSAVSVLGNATANVTGTAELLVRNTPAYLATVFLSAGRTVKGQLGEYFPSLLTTLGKTIQQSGITSLASDSISAQAIESTTSSILTTTESAVMIGCIIMYIGGVIIFNLLFYIIFILYTSDDIGFAVGIPGVARFYMRKKQLGGRKTIKQGKRKHKRMNRKYTHKRH